MFGNRDRHLCTRTKSRQRFPFRLFPHSFILSLSPSFSLLYSSLSSSSQTHAMIPRSFTLRISPPLRTRLTNLAFYSVALLSLCTVSLAMSGVGPASLPCPARSSTVLKNHSDHHDGEEERYWSGSGSGSGSWNGRDRRGSVRAEGEKKLGGRNRKWLVDPTTPPPSLSTASRIPTTTTTTTLELNERIRNYYQSFFTK